MYEKYDAFVIGQGGGGGEYIPQIGFGWTNGVILSMIEATYPDYVVPPADDDGGSDDSGSSVALISSLTVVLVVVFLMMGACYFYPKYFQTMYYVYFAKKRSCNDPNYSINNPLV
jgi:hypothetical protein